MRAAFAKEMRHPARLARRPCPVRELPSRGQLLMFDRKSVPKLPGKVLNEVTDDTLEQQEEDVIDAHELLLEEISIDGMCGVY
jgi:mycofactocin precursor